MIKNRSEFKDNFNDTDVFVENFLMENDDTSMPIPSIEDNAHRLISKVRKYYLEYIVSLLSTNFLSYHGKKLHLPSAVWRCAKFIELRAARMSMVVELYRQNIVAVIKELKLNTKRKTIYKTLFNFLHAPPENEKRSQTNLSNECTCLCTCNKSLKNRKTSYSNNDVTDSNIPRFDHDYETKVPHSAIQSQLPVEIHINTSENKSIQRDIYTTCDTNNQNENQISIEAQDAMEDEVLLQMEQLFKGDSNEIEDDLFEGTFCDDNLGGHDKIEKEEEKNKSDLETNHSAKTIDERLELLSKSGILPVKDTVDKQPPKQKNYEKKWLCEMYFQKLYLCEKMDEIRDNNRNKHTRIKNKFIDLFGEDSDDEQAMSPLDETTDFMMSCQERMAPWVVKMLTPYYVKGQIRGKILFKALAKHLIKLIYQCSKHPSEYEVQSFVGDFLKNHPKIKSEADFKYFKIANI